MAKAKKVVSKEGEKPEPKAVELNSDGVIKNPPENKTEMVATPLHNMVLVVQIKLFNGDVTKADNLTLYMKEKGKPDAVEIKGLQCAGGNGKFTYYAFLNIAPVEYEILSTDKNLDLQLVKGNVLHVSQKITAEKKMEILLPFAQKHRVIKKILPNLAHSVVDGNKDCRIFSIDVTSKPKNLYILFESGAEFVANLEYYDNKPVILTSELSHKV